MLQRCVMVLTSVHDPAACSRGLSANAAASCTSYVFNPSRVSLLVHLLLLLRLLPGSLHGSCYCCWLAPPCIFCSSCCSWMSIITSAGSTPSMAPTTGPVAVSI